MVTVEILKYPVLIPSDLRNVSALAAVRLERLQIHDLTAVMLMGVRSEKRQRWRRGGRGAIER